MNVRFYFDYVSPYARVASAVIHDVCARHGATCEAVPVLFAGILNAQKNVGPAEVAAKRPYVLKDAYRKAAKLGVSPIVPPPAHPFNPLVALRTTSLVGCPIERARVIEALFAEAWTHGRSIESASDVKGVLQRLGVDASIVEQATTPEAKALLATRTEAAVAEGVFGVPTFVVAGEVFFGVDALPYLEDFLDGRDPVPGDLIERWKNLPSSATRKR